MKAGRIIVVSSRAERRKELRGALEFEDYEVVEAETTDQTIERISSGLHDVLILDSEMEGIGWHELCRTIRPKSDLGIIVLNRDDSEQSRIDALNAGADDSVPPVFLLAELLARVRAILRRMIRPVEKGHQIVLHDRAVDLKSHEIKGPGNQVGRLTPKEFLVLQYLASHANQLRTHQNLAQKVWQRDGIGEVEYLRVVIGQLRRKLEPDPENPRYIVTERAAGYRFQMPPSEACMTKR
jgi:two-component system KDP operon response regulator KdpE